MGGGWGIIFILLWPTPDATTDFKIDFSHDDLKHTHFEVQSKLGLFFS